MTASISMNFYIYIEEKKKEISERYLSHKDT